MDGRRAALALLLLQHLAAAVAQVIFDPASVFTTYTDDGACGARGDDAVFDISECSSGRGSPRRTRRWLARRLCRMDQRLLLPQVRGLRLR